MGMGGMGMVRGLDPLQVKSAGASSRTRGSRGDFMGLLGFSILGLLETGIELDEVKWDIMGISWGYNGIQ